MTQVANKQSLIIRTERGLTIAGTRITIYDVMDYLKAEYPLKFIRDIFNLTEAQISSVVSYIDSHKTEVETEYQEVLQIAEENRQYWQEHNRELFARIAVISPSSSFEKVRAKLQERKAQREAQQS